MKGITRKQFDDMNEFLLKMQSEHEIRQRVLTAMLAIPCNAMYR